MYFQLLERATETEISHLLSHSRMPTGARSRQGQNQEPRILTFHPDFPHGCLGSQHLVHQLPLPRRHYEEAGLQAERARTQISTLTWNAGISSRSLPHIATMTTLKAFSTLHEYQISSKLYIFTMHMNGHTFIGCHNEVKEHFMTKFPC